MGLANSHPKITRTIPMPLSSFRNIWQPRTLNLRNSLACRSFAGQTSGGTNHGTGFRVTPGKVAISSQMMSSGALGGSSLFGSSSIHL